MFPLRPVLVLNALYCPFETSLSLIPGGLGGVCAGRSTEGKDEEEKSRALPVSITMATIYGHLPVSGTAPCVFRSLSLDCSNSPLRETPDYPHFNALRYGSLKLREA